MPKVWGTEPLPALNLPAPTIMSPTASLEKIALSGIEVKKLIHDIHVLFFDFSSLKAIFAPIENPIDINTKFLEYRGYSDCEKFYALASQAGYLLRSVAITDAAQTVESVEARDGRQWAEHKAFVELREKYEIMKKEVVGLRLHFEQIASYTYPFPVTYRVIGNHPGVRIQPERSTLSHPIKIEPAEQTKSFTPPRSLTAGFHRRARKTGQMNTPPSTPGHRYRFKTSKPSTPTKLRTSIMMKLDQKVMLPAATPSGVQKKADNAKVSNELGHMMLKMSFSDKYKPYLNEVKGLEPQPWAEFLDMERLKL